MARFHSLAGATMFVVFLVTGQYMRYFHDPPVAELEPGLRMLFRSRHIHLLFIALLLLAFGLKRPVGGPKWLLRLGIALLTVCPVLLLAAFVIESSLLRAPIPLSVYGIQTALAGTLVYLIPGWWTARRGA